jgi:hypothetical protein
MNLVAGDGEQNRDRMPYFNDLLARVCPGVQRFVRVKWFKEACQSRVFATNKGPPYEGGPSSQ